MTKRQGIVSSLILVPIRSGLRGFCLTPLISPLCQRGDEGGVKDYQQKNPLRYYALPFLFEFVNKVHFRLVGFTEAKRYRKINFFATSALLNCIIGVNPYKAMLIAVLVILSSLFNISAHALTGTDVAQKVFDRDHGKDSYAKTEMTLIDKKGNTRVREMISQRKKFGELEKSLIRFTSPADIEGTGFLSWENKDRDDDQFLYLPALRRVRRIVTSQKDMGFVNTDFTYEDLQRRKVENDQHRLLGEGKIKDWQCWILESIPKKESDSQYGKFVSWVVKEIYVPIKVEFYDKKGQMAKRYVVEKLQKIDGIWTEMELVMHDLKNNHETKLKVKETRYNKGISGQVFTTKYL